MKTPAGFWARVIDLAWSTSPDEKRYRVRVGARGIAERLTHRLVFRRRLPKHFDRLPLYVSTEAGLRYIIRRPNGLDPVLLAIAERHVKPGMVVWDVGANVGLFSFAAAAKAGPTGSVLAFEPDPWLCRLLRRSATGKGTRANVEVLPVAASDTNGCSTFNIAVRSRSTNFIEGYGTTQTGGSRETLLVPTMALDSVLGARPVPDFVKIDVEGAEVPVLHGAGTILDHRPIVVCEVASTSSPKVTDIFRSFGYRLYDADLPGLPEVDFAPPTSLAIPG